MTNLNRLDPEDVGKKILEMKQSTGVSTRKAADMVFSVLSTGDGVPIPAVNGSRPADGHSPDPPESV